MDLQLNDKVAVVTGGSRGAVRAVTVSPGPTRTGVWTDPDGMVAHFARVQGVDHADFVAGLVDRLGTVTGRLSEPEEVARAIAFAASPNNITGNELLVDGGIIKNVEEAKESAMSGPAFDHPTGQKVRRSDEYALG